MNAAPLPGIMYGLTHEEDGRPIIRESRLLKVSIGLPRGKAINVWTVHQDGKVQWKVCIGFKRGEVKSWFFDTRQQVEDFYAKNAASAPVCSYPRKIPFFTFTRPVLGEDGVETFLPDFAAIEAHGPCPTEIDVIFFDDNPFAGAYQMWSASELKCKGDGINAMRVWSMHQSGAKPGPNDGKYFPIVGECWMKGCEFAGNQCKPGGDLKFQLAQNIRLGGTAYFHTTGFRSISQIFSSLERIKTLTRGRLTGLPLTMTLRPYKTTDPQGKPATQYGVGLELRAEDMVALRHQLMANLWEAPQIAAAPKLLEEASDAVDVSPISAGAMTAEFYPDAAEDDTPAPKPEIAKATDAKTDGLADKLKERRGRGARAEGAAGPGDTRNTAQAPPRPPEATSSPVAPAAVTEEGSPPPAPEPAPSPADGDLF